MALKVGDILRRLGLRGAIIRYGERWKTQEIRDLNDDIRIFCQKYEPYLEREEEYHSEFSTDLKDILQKHGPRLWPEGRHSEITTRWLFPVGEVPEYPEDIYFTHHLDKIEPLFAALLSTKVKVYCSNQRYAKLKANEEREVAAATNAATVSKLLLSQSDPIDHDSKQATPSSVHIVKIQPDEDISKAQNILKREEFNLRKRKIEGETGLSSLKRLNQSTLTSQLSGDQQERSQALAAVPVHAVTQPQVTNKSIAWPLMGRRRARKSRVTLRPLPNEEDKTVSAESDRDVKQLITRPLTDVFDLLSQQQKPLIFMDARDTTEHPKLVRRTQFRFPTVDRETSPLLHTPPFTSSVDADLGAADTLLARTGSSTAIDMQSPSADISVSAQIITRHFAHEFVKFTLPVTNGRRANKCIKLTDCANAILLYQTVITRFKHALLDQVPSEISFTFNDEDCGIDADESGQATWDGLMQTIADRAPPGTCPIVATVRI